MCPLIIDRVQLEEAVIEVLAHVLVLILVVVSCLIWR